MPREGKPQSGYIMCTNINKKKQKSKRTIIIFNRNKNFKKEFCLVKGSLALGTKPKVEEQATPAQ